MMSPNVLDHEPHIALFVPDNDPLVFYKAIARQAAKIRAGTVYVEINEKYGNDVREIFVQNGYESVIIKDIDRKDRIVKSLLRA
jgi:release factor glutamine methyltransferase